MWILTGPNTLHNVFPQSPSSFVPPPPPPVPDAHRCMYVLHVSEQRVCRVCPARTVPLAHCVRPCTQQQCLWPSQGAAPATPWMRSRLATTSLAMHRAHTAWASATSTARWAVRRTPHPPSITMCVHGLPVRSRPPDHEPECRTSRCSRATVTHALRSPRGTSSAPWVCSSSPTPRHTSGQRRPPRRGSQRLGTPLDTFMKSESACRRAYPSASSPDQCERGRCPQPSCTRHVQPGPIGAHLAIPRISPTSTPLTQAHVSPLCAPRVLAPSLAPSTAVPCVQLPLSASRCAHPSLMPHPHAQVAWRPLFARHAPAHGAEGT